MAERRLSARRLTDRLNRRRAGRLVLLAAAGVLFGASVYHAWQWGRARTVERELARLEAAGANPADAVREPILWIAQAQHRSSVPLAAALLRQAADGSRGEVRQAALYDLGNLYLREALRVQASGAEASALPLFELAKENYRAVLYEQPGLWDAKFNLELALRAQPDADPDEPGASPILTGERAVTTMRAFTLGLP